MANVTPTYSIVISIFRRSDREFRTKELVMIGLSGSVWCDMAMHLARFKMYFCRCRTGFQARRVFDIVFSTGLEASLLYTTLTDPLEQSHG